MHKEAEKSKVFSYIRKNKIYDYEIDWNKEFELEIQDMKKAIEDKINEEGNTLFQDKEFIKFCEKVLSDEKGVQEYFNSDSVLYKTNLILLFLKYGSFEFVDENILKNVSQEQRNVFLNDIFDAINTIQATIYSENSNKGNEFFRKNPTNLEEIYLNFLENFAPQMLSIATASRPIKEDFIYLMNDLQSLVTDKFANPNLFDEMLDFKNIYQIDVIVKILELYDKAIAEKDPNVELEYYKKIDKLCINGVTGNGFNTGILNLLNSACFESTGLMIDIIPTRIKFWKADESSVSDDIDYIVSIINRYGSSQVKPIDLLNLPIVTKSMQLVDLKILSEKENEKIKNALDKALHRDELETPDMSEYDEKILKKIPFDAENATKFLDDCKVLTIKEGVMPAKYNEYLISCMLDEKTAVNQILARSDRTLILENYARRRSKEILGKPRVCNVFRKS